MRLRRGLKKSKMKSMNRGRRVRGCERASQVEKRGALPDRMEVVSLVSTISFCP